MKCQVTCYLLLLVLLLKDEVCSMRTSTYDAKDPYSTEVDSPKTSKDNSTMEADKTLLVLPLENKMMQLIRRRRDGGVFTGALIASIATIGGSSLVALTTSPALAFNRNFVMTVDNYLKYSLASPKAFRWYGYISDPPRLVRPCYTEAVAGHKKGHSATGTSGIVSWRVNELSTTIIIFWSVPYGSAGCNHFGIGVYPHLSINEPNSDSRYFWFNNLYFGPEEGTRTYFHTTKWADFCSSSYEISQTAGGIKVTGIMSTSSAAKIEVRVEPEWQDNLVTEDQCAALNIRS